MTKKNIPLNMDCYDGGLLICGGCGRSIVPGERVYSPDDETIICTDCRNKES